MSRQYGCFSTEGRLAAFYNLLNDLACQTRDALVENLDKKEPNHTLAAESFARYRMLMNFASQIKGAWEEKPISTRSLAKPENKISSKIAKDFLYKDVRKGENVDYWVRNICRIETGNIQSGYTQNALEDYAENHSGCAQECGRTEEADIWDNIFEKFEHHCIVVAESDLTQILNKTISDIHDAWFFEVALHKKLPENIEAHSPAVQKLLMEFTV